MTVVGSLFVAWVLSWFSVDDLVCNGINELFNKTSTRASYYLIFLIFGLLIDIIRVIQGKDIF